MASDQPTESGQTMWGPSRFATASGCFIQSISMPLLVVCRLAFSFKVSPV
jgi:hypothetical protein